MSVTGSPRLKRYMMDITGFPRMVESQDGAWCRFDDVQSILLNIKIVVDSYLKAKQKMEAEKYGE